ncbi:uncharacterized protein F4807DRAFT_311081 [Annulohypoxylon truncatum]|uniref:uncharacterized protein n=1 Tax=Annulohypoxylon truncatum TaxID=327061 RepID=UPI0020072D7A|nr:uncharacterized protein F4807DRAFT_311081 [Annulohypoxylon truncatum]KAI1213084.1 hypothetical protein F4807DRAFT_311081 [Annulohypoxylon truncatum]
MGLTAVDLVPGRTRKAQFWPNWIGEEIAGARVWVYGYNANVWFDGSHDYIVAHATELLSTLRRAKMGWERNKPIPTVLVGHSLGGILIKQAMLLANSPGKEYSYLFDAVVAVAFCGTPHRGSVWANRLFGLFVWEKAPHLVNLLRRGTPYSLMVIADKFNNIWRDKPVVTFVETKGVHLLGKVPRSSSLAMPSQTAPGR